MTLLSLGKRYAVSSSQFVRPSLISRAVASPKFIRFNSNQTPIESESNEQKDTDYNEEIDDWLSAIKELKEGFVKDGPYNPVSALAPPGKTTFEINSSIPKQAWKPTEEQLKEYEALSKKVIPLPKDEILQQVTNLIMRHGKKATAERNLSKALYYVYLVKRENPIKLLLKTLEDMSPLLTTKTLKTGVAKATIIPVPLTRKQRIRTSFNWILEGSNKRKSPEFAVRLGEEILACADGKSSGYEKRAQMHKTATAQRAYVRF